MSIWLRGGRVCDPGTGFDGVADVLVHDGTVAAVGAGLAAGAGVESRPSTRDVPVLDVSGLVVGPGFVDLHSHVNSVAGQRLQAMDGVTTSLELEAGLTPTARAYDQAAAAGMPLNYGFSASWAGARGQVLLGREPDATMTGTLDLLGDRAWQRSSSPQELAAWLSVLEDGLADGALGIGVLQGYAPRTDPAEFLAVARLASRADVPVFAHVRELVETDPTTPIDGSSEIAVASAETGAALHHCHVNSTSRRHIDRVLATLDKARADGARVTVETYPYGAGATGIGAYFLDPDRLPRWGMRPSDIVVVATGERIADDSRLRELRQSDPSALCITEFLDEREPADQALLRRPLAFPDAIVASDAMPVLWPDGARDSDAWPLPVGGATHPRTAGTFTKTLRLMVRETGTWTWLEAFRRCSYLPARVLDSAAPATRAKGHLGVGADADIVVVDPATVTDRATYLDSTRPAQGVRHLLVGGTFVVRDGILQHDARPGRGLRGTRA
jgi:cytosine/adenosine deaminase-related metal-dependent hydrolase